MKNKRFEIGDEVRVIFSSSEGFAKDFFYQDSLQESYPESDKKIMLGGTYKILDVERRNSGTSYKLLVNASSDDEFVEGLPLRKSNLVQNCRLECGDLVKFRPTCGERDVKYLLYLFDNTLELSNPENFYRVSRILNKYYIFLEDFEGNEINYPFRWEDFKEF